MADTVSTSTIFEGSRTVVLHLTNHSDGTGESAVQKLDISALTGPNGEAPTSVKLMEARWSMQGFSSVKLEWDHTANDEMLICAGNDYISFAGVGGKADPKSAGGTGDVLLTTTGAAADATYDMTLVFNLKD